MSNIPKQKTLLQTAVENRDYFQGRLINNMVDTIYFAKKKKSFKTDTQERADAANSIKEAEKNIKDTEILLESFDELITQLSKTEEK